jgi:hypothetical protein
MKYVQNTEILAYLLPFVQSTIISSAQRVSVFCFALNTVLAIYAGDMFRNLCNHEMLFFGFNHTWNVLTNASKILH